MSKRICGAINHPQRTFEWNVGAPQETENEPLFDPALDGRFLFVELTAYPQRSALEPLLTIED